MEPSLRAAVEQVPTAWDRIDAAFRDSPQFYCSDISKAVGAETLLKVECLNPIRSFKGRGVSFLLDRRFKDQPLVCASAGNFGMAMAYVCQRQSRPLTVFVAENANATKIAGIQSLGATLVRAGRDFDDAKAAAQRFAAEQEQAYVEDGKEPEIAVGAGTMAMEITRSPEPFDAVLVPVGNGALINGVGGWFKLHSPQTRVVGVCAAAAPAMERSWRAGEPVSTDSADTLADGIAVRIPVPEALTWMRHTVDDMILVSEEEIADAMRLALYGAGLVVEGAGAAGLAGALRCKNRFERIAVPICGGNLTPEQIRRLSTG